MGERDKRKRTEGSNASKKRQWRDSSRAKGMPLGTRGVLVSCVTGKENHAAREAISIFAEAYEQLCPGALEGPESNPSDAGGDISAIIACEVADLKDRSKQPFFFHSMGVASLVYVSFQYTDGPSAGELVTHACREAIKTQQNKTRLCNKFYPVDHVCAANMTEIVGLAKRVAETHFSDDEGQGVEFSVEFEKRAAPPELERMEIITAFADAVKQPPNKVNLTQPVKSIIVNIAKGTCGVSVGEDYKKLSKYNMRLLVQSATEKNGEEGDVPAKVEVIAAPSAEEETD